MSSVLRYLSMVAIAAVLTLSSFYLMHRLIDRAPERQVVVDEVPSIRFGPVEFPEATPGRTPQPPPEPPEPVEEPPIPTPDSINRVPPEPLRIALEPSDYSDGPGILEGRVSPPSMSQHNQDARPESPVAPLYPQRAARDGVEGWVRVEVVVGATGLVRSSRVIESNPRGVFDEAALRTVNRWSWSPRLVNGRAVEQTVVQELVFSLNEG